MIKNIKNLFKDLGEILTHKDRFYMEDLCCLYEPVINHAMSAKDAGEILEVVGKIKDQGKSNYIIIHTLERSFPEIVIDEVLKELNRK